MAKFSFDVSYVPDIEGAPKGKPRTMTKHQYAPLEETARRKLIAEVLSQGLRVVGIERKAEVS